MRLAAETGEKVELLTNGTLLMVNGQSVIRQTGCCKFVREGMTFLRAGGVLSCP